ncbi:MAG: BMP family ABC transporter substrate-binding protein [Acidimicrobiales bacterium]
MDNWTDPPDPGDSTEQLRQLRVAQHELWARLRGEDDPEVRMGLLARFRENREVIEQLEVEVGDVDPNAIGLRHRVELVDDAGADPTARAGEATPAPRVGPTGPGLFDDRPFPGRFPTPGLGPDDRSDLGDHSGRGGFGPSDIIDLGGGEHGSDDADSLSSADDPPAGPWRAPIRPPDRAPSAVPPVGPASFFGEDRGERRPPAPAPRGARPRPERVTSSRPVPGPATRAAEVTGTGSTRPRALVGAGGHSPQRVLILLGGLLVVLGFAWVVLSGGTDDPVTETASGEEGNDPASPTIDAQVAEIDAVLRGLGLTSVRVERRGDAIHLIGTVADDGQRQAAIGAATALAGDTPVEGSELVVDQSTATTAPPTPDAAARATMVQAELNRIVGSTPIIFGSGETTVTELHQRILNTVAGVLKVYPEVQVRVVGFTDDSGNPASNERLSLDRANAVTAYLVAQGVPQGGLLVEARGDNTASGSQAIANLERRVEFEVVVPDATAVATNDTPLRIAIVAPSARNDLAFTQSIVDAVDVIAAERGNVEISVTDNTFVPEEAAGAIRDYAAQDYDLVIAHGSQFGAALLEIAPEFPGVAFAWGTASDTFGLPNVYAYDAAAGQGGYVLGAMAARLSQSGVVGVVGPIEVGDAKLYVDGFEAGARAEQNPPNVLVTYTGSFSDLTLAAETAQGHIDGGADVMTGSAQMVVGAVSTASERGVLWFGTQSNQTPLAPQLVVASQVYHWEVILRQIVADIDGGALGGKTYSADLANGGLVIEYNPGYALPDDVRQRADELIGGIVSGSVSVPVG